MSNDPKSITLTGTPLGEYHTNCLLQDAEGQPAVKFKHCALWIDSLSTPMLDSAVLFWAHTRVPPKIQSQIEREFKSYSKTFHSCYYLSDAVEAVIQEKKAKEEAFCAFLISRYNFARVPTPVPESPHADP